MIFVPHYLDDVAELSQIQIQPHPLAEVRLHQQVIPRAGEDGGIDVRDRRLNMSHLDENFDNYQQYFYYSF